MAKTIKCSDCGAKVSIHSDECKRCGAPIDHIFDEYDEAKQRKRAIFGYLFGVIALALAVNAFSVSFFAFLLFILASLLITPITNQLIESFNPINTGILSKIVGYVLFFMGFLAFSGARQSEPTPPPAPVAKTAPQPTQQPKPPKSEPQSAPTSEGQTMSFEACSELQNRTIASVIGTEYKHSIVVDTKELRMVRVCTNDGSVLITCNALDQKVITAQSPDCPL